MRWIFLLLLIHAAILSSAANCVQFKGVNLASAEFGENSLPGVYGTDYVYPEPNGNTNYFVQKGMNVFRLPFKWERLQNSAGGALNSVELTRLKNNVNYITNNMNSFVLLDPHNYARYYGKSIGSAVAGAPSSAQFADFWIKLANEFKGNAKVMFGLMNEPYSFDSEKWAQIAQQAINAIRSTGADQLILVPGTRWTGAHSWFTSGGDSGKSNADALISIQDSNFAFEFHQYFDSDFSGTNAQCRSPNTDVVNRMHTLTNWLKTNNKRGFLGEFGAGNNPLCNEAANNVLNHLEANNDVWMGWTWWAAGPWWGNYFMSLEPKSGVDAPQMTNVLIPHICQYSSTPSKSPTTIPPSSSKAPTTRTPSTSSPPSANPPGSTTNSIAVFSQDSIVITQQFSIQVSYAVSDSTFGKTIVVDILDSNFGWFGKGSVNIGTARSGRVSISISPQNAVISKRYTLKAWIVSSSIYNSDPANAWMQEIVSNSSKSITFVSSLPPSSNPSGSASKTPTKSSPPSTSAECIQLWEQCGNSGLIYSFQISCCGSTTSICAPQSGNLSLCVPIAITDTIVTDDSNTLGIGIGSSLAILLLGGAIFIAIRRKKKRHRLLIQSTNKPTVVSL
jgi:endoglucanase